MPHPDVVTSTDLLGPDGPEWFTAALTRAGVADGGRVAAVSGGPIGTGQVGESVRFELTWDGGGRSAPQTVVGKFPSTDPTSRATARVVQTYEREIGFYRHLHGRVDIPTPSPFHAAIVDETGDFTLVMSDVIGARQGDQLAGCSRAEAELMAVAAAGLHAPTGGADERFADAAWLGHPDTEGVANRELLYQMVLPGFLERYAARLGPEVCDVVSWLSTRLVASFEADRALDIPRCVVHGDFRLDNMLFRYGTDGTAESVTVVDWQTVSVGSGPSDLAYGIGSGLPTTERRTHERAVFERYCDEIDARSDTGTGISREALWQAYRLGACSGIAMAVTASMIVGRTDRGDEMFCVMAERHAAQVLDLDTAALID